MWKRCSKALVFAVGVLLAGCIGLYAVSSRWPAVGAKGADCLRRVLGNQAVADLEALAFRIKDGITRAEYAVGLKRATAPWGRVASAPLGIAAAHAAVNRTRTTEQRADPPRWHLADLQPLGKLHGEGEWSDYLRDETGTAVARRTFLQPDSERPYAVVAIVAFDLQRVRLHFVLGTKEPSRPAGPHGTGRIPEVDRKPGVLLAAFNGGFKATHGHFGAMADGVVAIPPTPGLATVAIHKDGRIELGQWGRDVTDSPDVAAWRQNERLILDGGQITDLALRNRVHDWGGTVDGKVVTWRSALGLSQDGGTLYYFAGQSLSMPALARAMQDAGAWKGMLLDINPYWVHFTAIREHDGKLKATPLLPEGMNDGVDRYLRTSERDFFYVTLAPKALQRPGPHVSVGHARLHSR